MGGGPWGQRGKSPKTLFFFFWKRHDNKILKLQIILSKHFVVIAQAPIEGDAKEGSHELCWVRAASGPLLGNNLFQLKVGLRWVLVNVLEWVQKWVFGRKSGLKWAKLTFAPTLNPFRGFHENPSFYPVLRGGGNCFLKTALRQSRPSITHELIWQNHYTQEILMLELFRVLVRKERAHELLSCQWPLRWGGSLPAGWPRVKDECASLGARGTWILFAWVPDCEDLWPGRPNRASCANLLYALSAP